MLVQCIRSCDLTVILRKETRKNQTNDKMTCLENIIVISTVFVVLVTIQATKAEGKVLPKLKYQTITLE